MIRRFALVLLTLSCCLSVGCGQQVEPVKIVNPPGDTSWDDLPPVEPAEGDWPWWRGPTFDGKAAEGQNLPTEWSDPENGQTVNVVWKVDVPFRGHSSPCIWGDRIFLTTADDDAEVQYVLCFDRATGKQLWQTTVHSGGFMHRHKKNSQASSTAACDGEHVFAAFMVDGGIWLDTLDLDGKIVRQEKVGPFKPVQGYAASPLLYKSLVIVAGDNVGSGFMAALHRKTGEIIWRIPRTDAETYSSPIIGHVCGRDQLLMTGPLKISSYDPNTGEHLWSCDGPTKIASTTMVFGEELIYASAGYPKKRLMCIRADGSGDVTDTHIVWQIKNNAAYVPSLLLHEGLLYMVNDGGQTVCHEADSGERVWRHDFNAGFSSSPILAGGNIYVLDEDGITYIFKPGRKFELLAKNNIDDAGFATPAFCGDRIYLRTLHHLYCLGKPGESE
jgi:outer membrane protein assembly factor BamB